MAHQKKHDPDHCACGHSHDTFEGLPLPLRIAAFSSILAIIVAVVYYAIVHPK